MRLPTVAEQLMAPPAGSALHCSLSLTMSDLQTITTALSTYESSCATLLRQRLLSAMTSQVRNSMLYVNTYVTSRTAFIDRTEEPTEGITYARCTDSTGYYIHRPIYSDRYAPCLSTLIGTFSEVAMRQLHRDVNLSIRQMLKLIKSGHLPIVYEIDASGSGIIIAIEQQPAALENAVIEYAANAVTEA